MQQGRDELDAVAHPVASGHTASRWSEHVSIGAAVGLAAVLLALINLWPSGRSDGGTRPEPSPPAASCVAVDRASLAPETGALFGVSLDWSSDSLAGYAARLGRAPAVAVTFADLPMEPADQANVNAAVEQARSVGAMLLLTLEPADGLARVTSSVALRLAASLDRYNQTGVPVVVRFAHEMNGSWYSWGQDPAGYVQAFRRVASAIHQNAPGSAMMWAPNYGGGYPFSGGRYQAPAGSKASRLLDTNGDGTIGEADDPYAPYWPGHGYVDWVGMSLYHWGNRHPWGENEVPEPHKFTDLLHGTYDGKGGDQTAVPDFYDRYARVMGIPMAVTETAAFYRPRAGGNELAVKQGWWEQVYAETLLAKLPQLKMVNWFEWDKHEAEVDSEVRWGVTQSPGTLRSFTRALPAWARFGTGKPPC